MGQGLHWSRCCLAASMMATAAVPLQAQPTSGEPARQMVPRAAQATMTRKEATEWVEHECPGPTNKDTLACILRYNFWLAGVVRIVD